MSQTCFSRSRLYRRQQGEQLERKERTRKSVPEPTVEHAASVIGTFPHFGGRKGQAYMLYHELGYISMKAYDRIKENVRRILGQEASRRKPAPQRAFYEHIRPTKGGEIWAEDFTELPVEGTVFKLALVVDVFEHYYLGNAVNHRATTALVDRPVKQALETTGGRGPEKFLLSDNGSQYLSEEHGILLTSAEIVQRRIPSCTPQYNGFAEAGMREVKSVFYNVWERRKAEGADEEKNLVDRVQAAVEETLVLMNETIPRPSLGSVTPADVHNNTKEVKKEKIRQYRQQEESRQDIQPWKRSYWEVLKVGLMLEEMSSGELLTKLAFFCRKPLRLIARRNRECVG